MTVGAAISNEASVSSSVLGTVGLAAGGTVGVLVGGAVGVVICGMVADVLVLIVGAGMEESGAAGSDAGSLPPQAINSVAIQERRMFFMMLFAVCW
jgi:hypothetical protein